MRRLAHIFHPFVTICAAGLFSTPVWSVPLDPQACERVRAEQSAMAAEGVAEDFSRGAEWGRVNLSAERLRRVARYIELEEQIQFRCPRPKPKPTPETIATPADPKAGKTPAASNSGDPGADTATQPTRKPETAAKPAQKKPKVNDAYVPPPPPLGGTEYQHTTPGLTNSEEAGSSGETGFGLIP